MQPAPEPDICAQVGRLVISADPVSVRHGLAQLLALPPLASMAPGARGSAELVLAEVLNNVAEHAYAEGVGPVEVTLFALPTGVGCQIVDQGLPMPGERLPEGRAPDLDDAAPDDLPEGGFGWHLIRSLTRDLSYLRSDDRNRLRFILPFDG